MNKLKQIYAYLRSYLPEQLPQTGAAMDAWISEIIQLAGLPDNSSFKTAIATMILHIDANTTRAAKQGFIKAIRKSISNQLAYEVIQREKTAREPEQ